MKEVITKIIGKLDKFKYGYVIHFYIVRLRGSEGMVPTSSVAQYSFCLDVFFKRDTAECIGLAVKGATFLKI